MLLSIDKNKIEEELKKSPRPYVVSVANLEPETKGPVEIPSTEAHSAINVLPPDAEAARERLTALRRRIIERGGETASGEALARIIDEIRGR